MEDFEQCLSFIISVFADGMIIYVSCTVFCLREMIASWLKYCVYWKTWIKSKILSHKVIFIVSRFDSYPEDFVIEWQYLCSITNRRILNYSCHIPWDLDSFLEKFANSETCIFKVMESRRLSLQKSFGITDFNFHRSFHSSVVELHLSDLWYMREFIIAMY